MTKSQPYRDSLLAALQDPEEAAAYLDAALEAGDQEAFLLALNQVAEAHMGNRDRSIDLWHRLQVAARPSLKQLLLSESAPIDLPIPERGKARHRDRG